MTPEAIKHLAALLAELPSLGPRQATRLAFYIASRNRQEVEALIDALTVVAKVKRCTRCFVLDELSGGVCSICASNNRNQALIAVVEKETDVLTLEKAKVFQGRYLVMSELPKDGILKPEHKQRLQILKEFIADLPATAGKAAGKAEEIILAFSPTTYGDVNATVIGDQLRNLAGKVTRLGRGIPTGGEIEFADELTLGEALKHRD